MTSQTARTGPPEQEELRHHPRQRVLFAGKLVYGEQDLTLDCAIRNLSPAGARVRVDSPAPLPQAVWLIELRTGVAYECQITWRKAPEYGVSFTDAHPLTGAAETPRLRLLKRLWLENATR